MPPGRHTDGSPAYHPTMRIWLLVILIALLPLRSWAGDAMAGQLLAQQLAAATQAEAAAPMADCPGHAAMDAADAGTDAGASACCEQCQLCSSVSPRLAVGVALEPPLTHARPIAAQPRFASASSLRLLRPPIS